ncbi:tRNA pseudouridine synthase-like 1 isoform X3 [Mustela putorius furo]|uniref:tRNA pseudouridine synthase n=1 Tax=Mustela putorius furo TaxID=9669 RepID=A0A8U0RB70_MUSPF|nr:tRNA pseudouridine synthase-like 1 isoform X3 [Mustela putorius furo]
MGAAAGSGTARYLVYFQYLGTEFNGVAAVRGSQRAVGVQNYLEAAPSPQEAAKRLNSVVPVKFTISSRTDAGVHALCNAAHLDVQRRSGQPPFSPEVLAEALNAHLRHPAIRCLDVDAMQEAAQHLLGTHDFSAFQSAGSPATSSVRTLRRASVAPDPGSPFILPQENRLQFWNLEFEAQSFLYKQVRRMTAVLVAVGLGTLMPAQVKVILESRDPLGRHQARVAPAHGLFLKSVLYRSLGGNPASVQQESEEAPGWPKNPHLETGSPKARGLEACRTEATDNPQISQLRSGRPGHTALPPALAPLCMPHGPLAPPPSWAPWAAMGELQAKGLHIKKGTATQPLVPFLLEMNTSGVSLHPLGAQE